MATITDPNHLERLIDRQMSLWELRRRASEHGGTAARRDLAHLAEGPWITLSKQRGSRARELGQRVAERLEWQCFDREILEAIARQSSMRDRILSRLDERAVGALEDLIAQIVVPHRPPQLAYIQEMVRVIWAMARHGNVVFLGRGANWLLDPRYGLRVRAVAPLDMRARRIATEEGLDPVSAERRVKADDETRAGFIRQVYRREIDDPLGYDLLVNLGGLGLDAAADAIIAALHAKLEA